MKIIGGEYIDDFGSVSEGDNKQLLVSIDRSKLQKSSEGTYMINVGL